MQPAGMTPSENGMQLTEHFEQCRLAAYLDDGGVPTIGWGHTYGVHLGDVCSQEQADQWLRSDYRVATVSVRSLVRVDLTQGEFDALCDFVFNLGVGNFSSSTLLRKLNGGDYAGAAAEFDRWDHVAGKVAQGLLVRRETEVNLWGEPDADR
jgi:lysozyme